MSFTKHPLIPSRSKDKKRQTRNTAQSLAAAAVDAFVDKKGRDIAVMDLRGISGVADYFVICTGDSDVQIKALADAVQESIRKNMKERPWHTEGYDHLQWVLLDYVDVVAHVFAGERRSFYDLERLWGDSTIETVPEDGSAADVELLREVK